MKIALTGGNGFVGSHLTHELLRDGQEVVQIARKPCPSKESNPRVSFFPASIDDENALARAFEGCASVAHLAGINREIGNQTYERIHVEGTRKTVAAAKRAGVQKIVLSSFLRARPNCGSAYHESKWKAEEIVRNSGLDYTVLKAGVIYGPGDQMLGHLAKALRYLPVFALVGMKEKTLRPLAIEDLVNVLRVSLVEVRLSRRTVPVVGPEELSLKEVAQRVAQALGKHRLYLPAPLFIHYVLAWCLEKIMKEPLTSLAQVRMLSEGISEPTPPCDPLPEDLLPQLPFTEEQIRNGLAGLP
jgi:NADH dehydrogenase